MITLTLKEQPSVPLEAEALSPDILAPLVTGEIKALPVLLGKRQCRVDDFFTVEGGDSTGDDLRIEGDAAKIKWIGRGMTRGRITIAGSAGMHLGAHMSGGTIDVSGNASDWLGAEMSGGFIRICGDAGGQVGAAYRGSPIGMTDGLEVGARMKRGTIVIGGMVRDFAGLQMQGGTIVLGGAESRTGAWMMRGTIISLTQVPLLPTFPYSSSYNPIFMRLLARILAEHGIEIPCAEQDGVYRRYTGDLSVPGKGEILVWQSAAS